MKYLLSLLLVCHVSHASGLPPCEPSWYLEPMVPLTLHDAPALPNVMLPLVPTYSFGLPPDYEHLSVVVHDADGGVVAGRVDAGLVVADDVQTPVWRPAAPLTPGATYTLTYSAADFYDCGQPLEGALTLTVARDPRPVPSIEVQVSTHDTWFSSNSGLSRSCGPGAIACEGRTGICCVRLDKQVMRSLELAIDARFAPGTSPYYRATVVSKTAELGDWALRLMFYDGHITANWQLVVPLDLAPPDPNDVCVEVTLHDLMLGQPVTTMALCSDRHLVAEDTSCDSHCGFGPDPIGTVPTESAELTTEPEPAADGGCVGGQASMVGLMLGGLWVGRGRRRASRLR